jgi:hypothetical protein
MIKPPKSPNSGGLNGINFVRNRLNKIPRFLMTIETNIASITNLIGSSFLNPKILLLNTIYHSIKSINSLLNQSIVFIKGYVKVFPDLGPAMINSGPRLFLLPFLVEDWHGF